jgi:hypothetical protein
MKYYFLLFLLSISTFGQDKNPNIRIDTINHEDLFKLKVDENIYEHGWLPSSYRKVPCFRDYRNDNIDMKLFSSKNNDTISLPTTPKRNALKILPYLITLNQNDSTFIIKGQVTGAWNGVTPGEFEIYVGQRIDTISNTTLSPNLHGDIYYNGEKVTETIIINTVPAFYMKNFQHFKCTRGTKRFIGSENNEMMFDILTKIDRNSVIVFGLSSCYAEIFEVGKLLAVNSNKKKKFKK